MILITRNEKLQKMPFLTSIYFSIFKNAKVHEFFETEIAIPEVLIAKFYSKLIKDYELQEICQTSGSYVDEFYGFYPTLLINN
jgi:hypothetical protein